MVGRPLRCFAILAFLPILLGGQVIFSRRVHKPAGRTHQQVWTWNPADGTFRQLTHSRRDHFQPFCVKDGTRVDVLFSTDRYGSSGRWIFERNTGREREVPAGTLPTNVRRRSPPVTGCSGATWTRDGGRFACSVGQDVLIYDSATKKEAGRAHFGERPTPPSAIAWSPDGKWLLAGTRGENDNSTARQSDYFVLDLGRMAWIPAGSGNDAMWLRGRNAILYSTPRELAPLTPSSKHEVWTAHLVMFDPASRRHTQVTSGVTNNIQPAPCLR